MFSTEGFLWNSFQFFSSFTLTLLFKKHAEKWATAAECWLGIWSLGPTRKSWRHWLCVGLGKRMLRADTVDGFNYQSGSCFLYKPLPTFSFRLSRRVENSSHKVHQEKFQLNRRKSFFTLSASKSLIRLHRKAVQCLEIFRHWWIKALSNLIRFWN